VSITKATAMMIGGEKYEANPRGALLHCHRHSMPTPIAKSAVPSMQLYKGSLLKSQT